MNKKTMIRVIAIIAFVLIVLPIVVMLSGCNKQLIDLTYSFDRAVLTLPNGEVVEGKVQSWTDYEDGDQIQVKINDKTYLIHSSQIVLIAE